MKQQAAIIADYFYIKKFGLGGFDRVQRLDTFITINRIGLIKKYEWALREFLKYPDYEGDI